MRSVLRPWTGSVRPGQSSGVAIRCHSANESPGRKPPRARLPLRVMHRSLQQSFFSSIRHVPSLQSDLPLPIVGYRITQEHARYTPLTRSCTELNRSPKTYLRYDKKFWRASEKSCERAPMQRVPDASLGSFFGANFFGGGGPSWHHRARESDVADIAPERVT